MLKSRNDFGFCRSKKFYKSQRQNLLGTGPEHYPWQQWPGQNQLARSDPHTLENEILSHATTPGINSIWRSDCVYRGPGFNRKWSPKRFADRAERQCEIDLGQRQTRTTREVSRRAPGVCFYSGSTRGGAGEAGSKKAVHRSRSRLFKTGICADSFRLQPSTQTEEPHSPVFIRA